MKKQTLPEFVKAWYAEWDEFGLDRLNVIDNDIKELDFENFNWDEPFLGDYRVGFTTFSRTGDNILLVQFGGDWQEAMCGIVYQNEDGSFEMYVPLDGNHYNRDEMRPWDNDETEDMIEYGPMYYEFTKFLNER